MLLLVRDDEAAAELQAGGDTLLEDPDEGVHGGSEQLVAPGISGASVPQLASISNQFDLLAARRGADQRTGRAGRKAGGCPCQSSRLRPDEVAPASLPASKSGVPPGQ